MSITFPTKDEFLAVFNLFPKGNPEKAYREVKYMMSTKKTFTGNPITWQLISESYSKYIAKRQDEGTEARYIKSLESFVKAGDYNINFDNEPSNIKKNQFEKGLDTAKEELKRRLGYE